MKEKALISACLLGTPCRYDGASKPCNIPERILDCYNLIPICPEVVGGLDTPRIPCEIKDNRVVRKDGVDVTEEYLKGANFALKLALENNCKLAILKEKSPSCGKNYRYDGSFQGKLIKGSGITADILMKNNIKVLSEDEI